MMVDEEGLAQSGMTILHAHGVRPVAFAARTRLGDLLVLVAEAAKLRLMMKMTRVMMMMAPHPCLGGPVRQGEAEDRGGEN